ncbi:hypothetical protein WKR88_13860 [Trinickia caryophylli]|uniref:hypothetical protein n=1 Tax=Trinickia caryophylli TaxID=28094 RepID=UPI00111BFB95|nr:hypothetical protein [Trinickia caryophylli]WQE14868.1 hypothetical protein U0034_20135 [Trinickia caryophylli]GLU35076.1 hypothetical protein Busp01_49180 [Trinickia caryophylli]
MREAIATMSAEGADVRKKRWLKKSASTQYLYAKSLTRAQRTELEQALEREFRHSPDPASQHRALGMWLSVQQARLRKHDPEHQRDHNARQARDVAESIPFVVSIPFLPITMRDRRRSYYSSPLRPEYHVAFDNFMRIIGDQSLEQSVRDAVAERLEYHWHSEKTIAPVQEQELEQHGAAGLAARGYRASTDPATVRLSAGERRFVIRTGGRTTTPHVLMSALRAQIQDLAEMLGMERDPSARRLVSDRMNRIEALLAETQNRIAGQTGVAPWAARTGTALRSADAGLPNGEVRAAAEAWAASRPELVGQAPIRVAQAWEEELSELDEQGKLTQNEHRILVEALMINMNPTLARRRATPPADTAALPGALERWRQIVQQQQSGHIPQSGSRPD